MQSRSATVASTCFYLHASPTAIRTLRISDAARSVEARLPSLPTGIYMVFLSACLVVGICRNGADAFQCAARGVCVLHKDFSHLRGLLLMKLSGADASQCAARGVCVLHKDSSHLRGLLLMKLSGADAFKCALRGVCVLHKDSSHLRGSLLMKLKRAA